MVSSFLNNWGRNRSFDVQSRLKRDDRYLGPNCAYTGEHKISLRIDHRKFVLFQRLSPVNTPKTCLRSFTLNVLLWLNRTKGLHVFCKYSSNLFGVYDEMCCVFFSQCLVDLEDTSVGSVTMSQAWSVWILKVGKGRRQKSKQLFELVVSLFAFQKILNI